VQRSWGILAAPDLVDKEKKRSYSITGHRPVIEQA